MPKLGLHSHGAHIFGGDGLWLQKAQTSGMENVSCSVIPRPRLIPLLAIYLSNPPGNNSVTTAYTL